SKPLRVKVKLNWLTKRNHKPYQKQRNTRHIRVTKIRACQLQALFVLYPSHFKIHNSERSAMYLGVFIYLSQVS
ncbi:hypothetical protein ACVZHT_12505, partial [Vibrio diabolicus]